MKCWAASLGGCAGGQSGEHYISANFFSSDKVLVEGFDWQKGQKQELPISAITSNILCRHHNSLLSDLDSHIGEIVEKIEHLSRLNRNRKKYPNRKWTVVSETIDGQLFERWLAKTAINLYCTSRRNDRWADNTEFAIHPPTNIVQGVYGLSEFKKPFGFYCFQSVGEKVTINSSVVFQTCHNPSQEIVGATLQFKGFRFLIWLSMESPPFLKDLLYRVTRMRFMLGPKPRLSHQLRLTSKTGLDGPTAFYTAL